ncbi:MAG TPA: adenylate/guanylate cyclase domain-containing protein [Candidatus Nitrosotenuis sp.]|nr:adenylate/guanylate cyclase domain-containing protein [Candidatus Nitrosotenuis sp.]
MSQDDTINVEVDGGPVLRTGFYLQIFPPEGGERSVPITRAQTTLGAPGERANDVVLHDPLLANRQAVLHYRQGQLFFTNSNPSAPARINGQPTRFKALQAGDEIALGGHRLRVVSLLEEMATLEGYTDPYRNRVWSVGTEPLSIGRPGKRDNSVSLEDPTVSRVHATIRYMNGAFFLEPETRTSPTRVNGERVEQPRVLCDGDLLQFGQQLLRFRVNRGGARPRDLVRQEATVLFCDIWKYSTMAEGRPLEEVILQMNEFYRAMGKIIEAHKGLLLTFLGDALMAVFGAEVNDPEDPARAVSAALAMQQRLVELNALWAEQGKPTLRMGVGINTGEVMVGEVGFTGRLEFAAMGDNTNLAARLEKLTREYDMGVLISGSTEAAVRGRFQIRPLGSTRVKGRETPVDLFEVVGPLP